MSRIVIGHMKAFGHDRGKVVCTRHGLKFGPGWTPVTDDAQRQSAYSPAGAPALCDECHLPLTALSDTLVHTLAEAEGVFQVSLRYYMNHWTKFGRDDNGPSSLTSR